MARKKRKKQKYYTVRSLIFTSETILLLQKALELFKKLLQEADYSNEKVVFAEKTMQQVQHKISIMKQGADISHLMTFDYNEKIILSQALSMYSLSLLTTSSWPKRARELQQCHQLATYFSIS